MSLASYLRATRNLVYELRDSLSEEDISEIETALKKAGKDGWGQWLAYHEEQSLKYLHATPAQRARHKGWNKDRMRPLLTVAALLHARRAEASLEVALNLETIHGLSHRDAALWVAEVSPRIFCEPELWPWDGKAPWE
jgi:hypothetical protein